MNSKDVTFVIPVFNLKTHRINNLKFILPYILKTNCKVLVVEQIDGDKSNISEILKEFDGVEHLLFKTSEKRFHKTGIVNWAVTQHVKTAYAWVNDADYYMKFQDVFNTHWNEKFIQPYEIAKKLSESDTNSLLCGKSINVDYGDVNVQYISMYGALSFIFDVNEFIKNKGMDSSIYGWGYEDMEFSERVNKNYCIQKFEFKGIHLYHPIQPTEELLINVNTYFDKIYCINLDSRQDRWEAVSREFKKNQINVERFSAISGNSISDEQLKIANPNSTFGRDASVLGLVENKAALGCLLSHLNVIKDAINKKYKKILIFEDDIVIGKNFHTELKHIVNLDWKMLYFGASQLDWSNIKSNSKFYFAKNTYGTFAYAVDCSVYDEIVDTLNTMKKSVDNLYIELQAKWDGKCYVFNPNLVMSNVKDSDIRESMNEKKYAEKVRWDLSNFTNISGVIKRILLIPDTPGWAFDNIAKAIVKYNPYPDKIKYEIIYATQIHHNQVKINVSDWDLVYVMWEGERMVNIARNVIRGCYSAIWMEHEQYSKKNIGEYFSKSGGVIFANDELKNSVSKYMQSNIITETIYDAADTEKFYPIKNGKNEEFTVIFVGNKNRPIKNFPVIEWICEQANVKLKVISDTPHNQLIYEYCQADLCINFSDFEGGPQTFIESSLCGTPMLIRNTNQLAKHIPCFVGQTKEDFVEILNRLKNNREECIDVGKRAHAAAINKFTYKIAAAKFADFFLKAVRNDYRDKLTVFIISSGDNPNYNDCVEAIKNQNCIFRIEEIKNIAPMSKAFQEMIDRCVTPYYIQVDEDMILEKNAVEKLYLNIKESSENICMLACMLRDHHLDFNICGIKSYKHYIMVKYPYNLDIISCEKEQLLRIEADGYKTKTLSDVVGIHSPKWTTKLIYERYFDLMEKWKIYKYDWLNDLPNKLLRIVKDNPTDENIYALVGALMSISKTEPIRKREKNFMLEDEAYENIKKMLR